MTTVVQRLQDAMNAHDARRLASLCAADYRSVQPLHPSWGFGGSAQVFENWSSVFAGVPDFSAELVASAQDKAQDKARDKAQDDEVEWAEWHWRGHHVDGSPFAMRGTTIFVVRDGLIVEGRLYMEPVEPVTAQAGDIATAVQELYQPPSAPV